MKKKYIVTAKLEVKSEIYAEDEDDAKEEAKGNLYEYMGEKLFRYSEIEIKIQQS